MRVMKWGGAVLALALAAAATAAVSGPLEVLQAAPFEAASEPALRYGPEWRCEFLSSAVRVNNNKKTFGGYRSKEFPYKVFYVPRTAHDVHADRAQGVVNAQIVISAKGYGNGGASCFAFLAIRKGLSGKAFDRTLAQTQRDYDAVLRALAARGIAVSN